MNKTDIFWKAILAGILIGIGVIINATLAIPALGALLFSFGLLTVIALKLPLYTGKIGFIIEGQKNLFLIFIGNAIGILCIIYIYSFSKPDFQLATVATMKFSKTCIQLFCDGILCGILIHFAVKIKCVYTTIMAIMIFILTGGEHCIADIPYLLISLLTDFSFINIFKFITIILGNSLGAIVIEKMLELYNE